MLLIALRLYVQLMFQFLLISFCNSCRLSYDVRKYQKINLLVPKDSRNSDNMNILSFFFIFLLSFSLLRKRKNDPHLKIILTNIAFLVSILYRFSNPHNKLKSCFTFQLSTHDTIEMKFENEIFNWKYHFRYFDATHKTNHSWNYLQTPKSV